MPTDKLPLSDEQYQAWKKRLVAARELRKAAIDRTKTAIQHYLGTPMLDTPDHDVVNVNKEFPFTEQKKAQLMFQVPEVQLEPLLPGLEQAALLFQAVVNHELGPHGANFKATSQEAITETLMAGIGVTKIGYEAAVGEREQLMPVLDPMTGQPQVDPMTGQPVTQPRTVPYLAKETYFWERVPIDKWLIAPDFEGSDYDKASWMAMEFEKDATADTLKEYGLPADFDGSKMMTEGSLSGEKDDLKLTHLAKKIRGVELWYYASRYDPKEPHPDKLRLLVLIDNWETPVRHQESPYQTVGPDGNLMGMRGFPLHPLTLRFVPDRIYPPSDIEMSLPVSDELSKGRTQMVLQRETSIPMRGFDRNRMSKEDAEKLVKGGWQRALPLDGRPSEIIEEIARGQFPRENFTFQEVAEREYEEIWALGKNQRGLSEDTTRTATEIQTQQASADVRLEMERGRVLDWFTRGTQKFASLLQLFKTEPSFVNVLGQSAQGLQAWDRTKIQGEYLFKVKPDSALRIDAAARRQQLLQVYNLTANDPNVARVELLKTLFQSFNIDPSRIVVEKLPDKGPEPPKLSLAFKGEDALNEAAMTLAQANGLQVPPQLLQMAQMAGQIRGMVAQANQAPPEHGGTAQTQEPLSKHAMRPTGTAPVGQTQRPTTVQ